VKSDAKVPRIAYIHAGTHKTGTTSIQAMLASNEDALASAGVYIPKTGRISADSAGHHNLAFQLNNGHQFNSNGGTLNEVLEEISRCGLPTVCLSSEEFEFVAARPSKLQELFDGFRGIGYDPRVILYLRPQADYLVSLYAEIIKRWVVDFEGFLANIMSADSFGESQFDYDKLVSNFERVFGSERLQVRLYRSADPSDKLLKEFLRILCGDRHRIDFDVLRTPQRMNRMLNYDEAMAARAHVLDGRGAFSVADLRVGSSSSARGAEFTPLTLLDVIQIVVHFWPPNDRVRRKYGVRIGGVSWETFRREAMRALSADPEGRKRKFLMRSMGRDAASGKARSQE